VTPLRSNDVPEVLLAQVVQMTSLAANVRKVFKTTLQDLFFSDRRDETRNQSDGFLME
jgi:hypothetical protein